MRQFRAIVTLVLFFWSISLFAMASEIQTTTTEVVNPVDLPDLYEASIAELQEGMDKGHFTSVDLVKVCLYCARLIL